MTPNRVFLLTFLLGAGAAGCGSSGQPGADNSGSGAMSGTASGSGGATSTGSSSASTSSSTSSGSGGSSGSSSSSSTGGGSPGSTGSGGGNVGSGGQDASGGGATTDVCTITATSEISSAIATVGIVTFSTDLAGVDSAHIDFGLDTNYGLTAPVDLGETDYRTLLLGMKQSRDYHYRIVVSSGATECASQDYTITTGALPNVLPRLEVNTYEPDKLAGGFLMTGQYQAMGGPTAPAYIIDADGDYVWGIAVGNYVTGVRMSYDGKYMWINGTDNTTASNAIIHRVTMDGLVVEDLSAQFGKQDHSITVLPDETVIFYGHDTVDCANIKKRLPDGTIEDLANIRDAHGAEGNCHVNFVEYSPFDQTLIFSDDLHNNYSKITLDGEPVWVFGGPTNQFSGDSMWNRQHGLNALGVDRLLYFNNGEMGAAQGSIAIEVQLDLDAMSATRVWTYQPNPPISNQQLGDVQRMPNGNTVVAFSTQGILHEVDADGNLLQEIVWPIGGAFGYIVKRPTLYGPPPR